MVTFDITGETEVAILLEVTEEVVVTILDELLDVQVTVVTERLYPPLQLGITLFDLDTEARGFCFTEVGVVAVFV